MCKQKLYVSRGFPGRVFTPDQVRKIGGFSAKTSLSNYARLGRPIGGHVFTVAPAGAVPTEGRVERPGPPAEDDWRFEPTPGPRSAPATPASAPASPGFRMAHETIDDLTPINGQRIAAVPDPEVRR